MEKSNAAAPGLTPGGPTSALPPDLAHLDQLSREQWTDVVAQVFLIAWPTPLVRAIVAAGFDEFERVTWDFRQAHSLHQDDMRRLFLHLQWWLAQPCHQTVQ